MQNLVTPLGASEQARLLAQRSPVALSASVRAAQRGDERAWDHLIAEFTPTLRRIVRGYGLAPEDVDDVVQVTWTTAHATIGRVRDPAALAGWLATTARRRALRARRRPRYDEVSDLQLEARADPGPSVAEHVARAERAAALRAAVRRLPPQQRTVLDALLASGSAGYEQIADRLGISVGSIGPTRARAFDRLRRDHELVAAVMDN